MKEMKLPNLKTLIYKYITTPKRIQYALSHPATRHLIPNNSKLLAQCRR